MNKALKAFGKFNNQAVVIGHRGYFYEVENSIRAFKRAIKENLKAVEFDIWLTKDEVPVIIHTDSDTNCISSTSNGKGLVKDFTVEEIKSFSLDKGEKIPLLEELFIICKDSQLILDIEIKEKEKKKEIVNATMKLIGKYDLSSRVFFSSFLHEYYDIIREATDSIEFKFLVNDEKDLKLLDFKNKSLVSLGVNSQLANKEMVDYYHSLDIPVSIYFYPDNSIERSRYYKLLDTGVDHFFCDDPRLCQEIFNDYYLDK